MCIRDRLSAALGNYLVIEAIDKNNAVDVLKTICQTADDMLTEEESVKLFVPKHVFFDYCEDYKSSTGSIPYNKEYNQYFVEGLSLIHIFLGLITTSLLSSRVSE